MFLDIGAGIILGILLGPSHSTTFNVSLGILFCLLPDFDLFFYLTFRKAFNKLSGKRFRDHRELFHHPLPFIVAGSIILAIFKPDLIPLFIVGSLEHFLHDSIGPGWGIDWAYPFSKKYFKLFCQLDMYHAGVPQKVIWIWDKKEMNNLTDKYGDEEWIKHMPEYLKLAPIWWSSEFSVFVLGIIVLITHK